MADRPRVGVRYCGGCNAGYDRVALVRRLADALPELELVPAEDGTAYPAALICHGCQVRCTGVSGLSVPAARQIPLTGDGDFTAAKKRLETLLAPPEEIALEREEIERILPHRPPLLLIDRVTRLIPGAEVEAELYVEYAWPVFQGHFPGSPVLPGAYTVEAMAQAAGLLLLSLARHRGKVPLLAEIRRARFHTPVEPGNMLRLSASLLNEREALDLAVCQGQAHLNGMPAAEAELVLALR